MEKLRPTVGVFGGIFDDDGNLLFRNIEKEEWGLPGGALYRALPVSYKDERLIRETLALIIETQVDIPQKVILEKVQPMPAMYPVVMAEGAELALAIIIGKIGQVPTKDKIKFVSVDELLELADKLEGNHLLWGRRGMFRMCLRMFASRDCPNAHYRLLAGKQLQLMHN